MIRKLAVLPFLCSVVFFAALFQSSYAKNDIEYIARQLTKNWNCFDAHWAENGRYILYKKLLKETEKAIQYQTWRLEPWSLSEIRVGGPKLQHFHFGSESAVVFSCDKKYFFTRSEKDRTILKVRESSSKKVIRTFTFQEEYDQRASWSPVEEKLSLSTGNELFVFDIKACTTKKIKTNPLATKIFDCALSSDGKMIAYSFYQEKVTENKSISKNTTEVITYDGRLLLSTDSLLEDAFVIFQGWAPDSRKLLLEYQKKPKPKGIRRGRRTAIAFLNQGKWKIIRVKNFEGSPSQAVWAPDSRSLVAIPNDACPCCGMYGNLWLIEEK